MTLLSRILGLVRDIVFARFFGATIVMDAFIVANRIPNMLRRFFAEGAFSQGFVPVMARYKENREHDDARDRECGGEIPVGHGSLSAQRVTARATPVLRRRNGH